MSSNGNRRRLGKAPLVSIIGLFLSILLLGMLSQQACSDEETTGTNSPKKARTSRKSSGKLAPNFKLKSLKGDVVELKSLRGKVVVIDFWATWCPPCKITLPLVNNIYKKTRGKEVEVLGINLDRGSISKVKSFIKKGNLSMPILIDEGGKISTKYGVRGIPTLVVIDQDGHIYDKHVGADRSLDKKVLKKIDELLN
ncbi:TlpA family protein disulfide reductase [bacterium]|nr:TlpA family protein disulfide reductase [bacterium]